MKKITDLGSNPMFSNGRTSSRSYLVVAIRPNLTDPNAVGLKVVGHDQYKFHFWPNETTFNITLDPENRYVREDGGLSGLGYVGIVLSRAEAIECLDEIKKCRGVKVAHREHVMDVLDKKETFDPNKHTNVDDFGIESGPGIDTD